MAYAEAQGRKEVAIFLEQKINEIKGERDGDEFGEAAGADDTDDLQKLKLKIEGLQDSKAWQAIQEKYQETGKLLDKGLSGLISDIKSLGLKIGKSRILDLKAELTPDGQGLNLRFPTTANVNLALPLIGNIVNLNAALDILTGVSIDIDTQTGLPMVILGECTSDPDSVQVNLLNRHSALINRIANTLSSFLRKTVSFTVQKEVCLLIRFFLNTLGVNVIPNIINKLQDGIHLQI
ncbi:BPI fold-containing family A member 2 [Loxodonta africana]|uniref:BPI fold-containing family A member 2 n=1 Tax=Loxodonta africana TaxID=9785 RepID=UPI0030CAF097